MRPNPFFPQPLPASMPSLAGGVPPSPPGTLYVKSAKASFRVPPRRFALLFGRDAAEVHVPVGPDDPYVSRRHGVLDGDERGTWWLRNEGRRPIQLPGGNLVLSGHEKPMSLGYTPLTIETPNCRSHLVEVYVVGYREHVRPDGTRTPTTISSVHVLSETERLVVTALAQRYLRQEPYPQPVSWKQTAEDLNVHVPRPQRWTPKNAENVVAALRKRLAGAPHHVPGLLREEGIGEPVGFMLSHNLIVELLKDATLTPADLLLLGEDFAH